jgi:hypothetical protein
MALFCEYCGTKIGFFAMKYYIDGKVVCHKCKEETEKRSDEIFNEAATSNSGNQAMRSESAEERLLEYLRQKEGHKDDEDKYSLEVDNIVSSKESNFTSYNNFADYMNELKMTMGYIEDRLEKIKTPIPPNHNVDDESKALYIVAYAIMMEADKFYGFSGRVAVPEPGMTFEKKAYELIHRGKEVLPLNENINLHYDEQECDKISWDLQMYLGQLYDDYVALLNIASKAALHGDKMLACAALRLLNGACIKVMDGR